MSLKRIENTLRHLSSPEPPEELKARCLATIPIPLKGDSDMEQTLASQRTVTRGVRPNGRVPRLVLAGAMATTLVIGFLIWNSASSHVTMAAAIQAFTGGTGWKTWHFVMRAPDGEVTETWLKLPDAHRTEIRRNGILTEIKVQKDKEGWIYLPERKQAIRSRIPIENPVSLGDNLRELKRIESRAKEIGGLTVTERRERGADGRALRVMQIDIDYAKHYGPPRPDGTAPKTLRYRVILDAESGRLIKREEEGYLTEETVAYDEPMPDTLFEWQPPAGVKVTEVGDWWGERLGRTVASMRTDYYSVKIHAVDLAANGDLWLTASWEFDDETLNTWGTAPPLGLPTDNLRRVYVGIGALGAPKPTQAVFGYAPIEPRKPTDPFPTRITMSIRSSLAGGEETLSVPVPEPAAWSFPPKYPLMVAHPERPGGAQHFDREREKARREYRERAAP